MLLPFITLVLLFGFSFTFVKWWPRMAAERVTRRPSCYLLRHALKLPSRVWSAPLTSPFLPNLCQTADSAPPCWWAIGHFHTQALLIESGTHLRRSNVVIRNYYWQLLIVTMKLTDTPTWGPEQMASLGGWVFMQCILI